MSPEDASANSNTTRDGTFDVNINTVTPNPTVISSLSAEANNLAVGQNGTGMLTIQNGGTLTNEFGTIGNLPGGVGTVTVTGAGSSWTNVDAIVVGGLGTGTLTIENGGSAEDGSTASSTGGSIGQSAGSIGTVIVTGVGSSWINGPSGGFNIGSFGAGALTIANGGRVIDITPLVTNIGNGAGSHGAVTVTGAGSLWSDIAGIRIGNSGTGALTIADSGRVIAPTVTIATNSGSIGTLNIGTGAGNPAAAPGTLSAPSVAFGAGTGTINFNHTSADYVFAPAISGDGAVNVLAGATILTADNTYTGGTKVSGGSLAAGDAHPSAELLAADGSRWGRAERSGGYGSVTGPLTNSGFIAPGSAMPGFSGLPMGAFTIHGDYAGSGGTMAINAFLGGDGSPSDRLVISGGSASGATMVRVTNVGGPGAETTGNGIPVVNAISGATTAPGAFALPMANCAPAASTMICFEAEPASQPQRLVPALRLRRAAGRRSLAAGAPRADRRRSQAATRRRTPCRPASPFRSSGPNSQPTGWCSLWRGNWAFQHPRHARRPDGRHLRAGWLRRSAPAQSRPG